MKKRKILFVVLVIIGIVSANYRVAEASESDVMIVPIGRTVELLTEDEMTVVSQGVIGDISQPMASNASYSIYRYTDAFDYYFRGNRVARADVECIVWHYTDGKVHLYQRTIGVSRLTYCDAARVYGSIVNTDGSYSYTTGDRVHIYLDEGTLSFAIDFYVSNTDAYFSCYEV